MDDNGWDDIGYSFLICGNAKIYQASKKLSYAVFGEKKSLFFMLNPREEAGRWRERTRRDTMTRGREN